jgi:hypothetical protein
MAPMGVADLGGRAETPLIGRRVMRDGSSGVRTLRPAAKFLGLCVRVSDGVRNGTQGFILIRASGE